MTRIPTAAGDIDSSELGRTLVHEHVFVLGEEYRNNYQDDWDEDEKIADAVADLNQLKSLGIDSIFDPTVLGLGRYIPRIQAIAAQTSLNIVVATGLYTFNDVPHQFHYTGPGLLFDQPEPLTELFVKDLTEGIADTGVRAAFLKCAIDEPGLTPGVERVLRAVAQASVQTGAPITVHTHAASESGLVAQKVFADEGVDLAKVIIGHSGDTSDLDIPDRARRCRLLPRHGPVRPRPIPAVRGAREHRRSTRAPGIRRPRRHLPGRILLHRLLRPGGQASPRPQLELPPHQRRRAAGAAERRRDRRRDRHHPRARTPGATWNDLANARPAANMKTSSSSSHPIRSSHSKRKCRHGLFDQCPRSGVPREAAGLHGRATCTPPSPSTKSRCSSRAIRTFTRRSSRS